MPVFTGATIFSWPIIALTVLTGAIFAILTGPVIARPVIALPVITGPIVTLTVVAWPVIALPVLARTLFAIFARTIVTLALFTRFAFLTRWRAFEPGVIAFCAEFVVLFLAVLFLPTLTVGAHRAGPLVFGADTAIGNHAEVMIGKLQIVFGLHTVTIQMGVRCQFAILLQHLGGIAPCAAVDPVELLSAILRATVIGAPATAVVTTIVVIQLQALPCLGAAQLEFRPIWNAG